MKKLSLLCILAILCTCLASCDEAIVVTPTNTVGAGTENSTVAFTDESTSPVEQTADNPVISSPEAVESYPQTEGQKIAYERTDTVGCVVVMPVLGVIECLDSNERDGKISAVCLITVRNIDYTQITEKPSVIPFELSIDKIYDKTSFFTESEGAIVSGFDGSRWYVSNDTVTVQHCETDIPVSEVGKQYVVLISRSSDDDVYGVFGLSFPFPNKGSESNEYFREQAKRIGVRSDTMLLCTTTLIHWYYNDTVPDFWLDIWLAWDGFGYVDEIPDSPLFPAQKFLAVQPGTYTGDFIDLGFGLPYKIEIGEGVSYGYYRTAEGDTVIVTVDTDFIRSYPIDSSRITDISLATQ